MRTTIGLVAGILIFAYTSCKKENTDFHLKGNVVAGNSSNPLSAVSVEVQKQVVAGGTFGSGHTTAKQGNTDSGGNYDLQWPRENFTDLKLIASKSQYIPREFALNITDFEQGNIVVKNFEMYPEAYINVNIINAGITNESDAFNFTFTNANFDCFCCNNGWKYFVGAAVDSSFQCKIYGDTWLKYQKQTYTIQGDSIANDSIWCPSFQTTNLNITY